MKNQHNFIKKLFVTALISISVVGSAFSIEEKDYKSMTARDRILLSISYYEVSMKYQALNNKALAESYRKEALKIEPDVVRYYNGELEVPKKTIEIDWNSIFADETSDEEPTQNVEAEENVIVEEENVAAEEEEDTTAEETNEEVEIEEEINDETEAEAETVEEATNEEEPIAAAEENNTLDYSLLEEQYEQLKVQFAAKEQECEELKAYKLSVENEKKDALIASFYMLSDEEKAEIKANKEQYSYDDIEAKLCVLCYKNKVNFGLDNSDKNENNIETEEPVITYNMDYTEASLPAWVSAVKNTRDSRK